MKISRFLIPLGLFLILAVFLGIGLTRDPHELPSPLINKAAPAFKLTELQNQAKSLSNKDMLGQVWLLNVWASWCVSCREEHALLVDFSKSGAVPIYGLNYKDSRNDALAWLQQFGNPYATSIMDADGRVGIDYGVYGVPETFVIDKTGTIRYKQIGPVTPEALEKTIIPLVRKLQQS